MVGSREASPTQALMETTLEFLQTRFYRAHADLLCASYSHWTGRPLVEREEGGEECILRLYAAPFALVSHGTETDPVFNFGNAKALELFELSWHQFLSLPSQQSAEPSARQDRAKLLARVSQKGFIDDYRGVRVSARGRRFLVEEASVWNLIDQEGRHRGQAAKLDRWSFI